MNVHDWSPTPPHTLAAAKAASPRLMLYCHDTFGLGHLRRTLAIARHLQWVAPRISQLIVTGSPVAHGLMLPTDTDYVKLPSVTKVGAGHYEARSIDADFDAVRALRSDIVLGTVRHYRPDVLLVDHAPGGMTGEAIPALRHAHTEGGTRIVLGLRDILDDPAKVRRIWTRDGVYDLLDSVYDRILIYGHPDIFDPVQEYGLSSKAAAKVRYVGYLGRPVGPAAGRRPAGGSPHVVATAGGGGDGYPVLRTLVQAARHAGASRAWTALVVTGPLMAAHERAHLQRLASGLEGVRVTAFRRDLDAEIAAAAAVVAMAGYNTVCEILAAECPALLVPRVAPRTEQLIRAKALQRRGLARVILPQDLTPESMSDALAGLLAAPTPLGDRLPLDGLNRVATDLEGLAMLGAPRLSAGAR